MVERPNELAVYKLMGQRFGQHFLKDVSVIDKILHSFASSGPIVEVGPGRGALTYKLLALGRPLYVIEIDHALQTLWEAKKTQYPHLHVIKADVLSLDWSEWTRCYTEPCAVISNLPYAISGPFLVRLAKHTAIWSHASLLLQKEMVEKAVAQPSTHAYGRLTVQVQRHCLLQAGPVVPPGAFSPPPKVWSQCLTLRPRPEVRQVCETLWDNVLRHAFCHKRQMMRRIFKDIPIDWSVVNVDPLSRPENVAVDTWIDFVLYLEKQGVALPETGIEPATY